MLYKVFFLLYINASYLLIQLFIFPTPSQFTAKYCSYYPSDPPSNIFICTLLIDNLFSYLMHPQDLATPEAFSRTPSRVWEFYHYRRELVVNKKPNAAHLAIAECEARLRKQGREVVVITQCTDDLHRQAGSKHVLQIHGENKCGAKSPNCSVLH